MSAAFLEGIRKTVAEEIRACSLLGEPVRLHPLPYDLDAEGELCSAALCGHVRPRDVPITANDFYSNLHAYVWVACDAVDDAGLPPEPRHVLASLEAAGVRGPTIEQAVHELAYGQPYVSAAGLTARAERIVELAKARTLVHELERLTILLRHGALTRSGVLERLSQLG